MKRMIFLELKTPLYDTHVTYGGKPVSFAGYLLPVQYPTGITAEHMAVRTAAGMFDVSHMGEVILKGPDALKNVQMLVANDCSAMTDGQIKYSPMCNENGGVVDDLLVYRKSADHYMLVINAANHDKDTAWIKNNIKGDLAFEDISADIAQIAVQGPNAHEILAKLADEKIFPVKYYSFTDGVPVGGLHCIVSKTGYTGEDGYELYTSNENAAPLWEMLMETGAESGLIPCGLGARDTLRLEAAMPLYGHEMDDKITPFEAGIGSFVKMNKDDFIGKTALESKGEPIIKRIGLELTDRGIARNGDKVFYGNNEIGYVTSGTMCPFLKKAVAMALVGIEAPAGDNEFKIEVRGKRLKANAVKLPFYKRTS